MITLRDNILIVLLLEWNAISGSLLFEIGILISQLTNIDLFVDKICERFYPNYKHMTAGLANKLIKWIKRENSMTEKQMKYASLD